VRGPARSSGAGGCRGALRSADSRGVPRRRCGDRWWQPLDLGFRRAHDHRSPRDAASRATPAPVASPPIARSRRRPHSGARSAFVRSWLGFTPPPSGLTCGPPPADSRCPLPTPPTPSRGLCLIEHPPPFVVGRRRHRSSSCGAGDAPPRSLGTSSGPSGQILSTWPATTVDSRPSPAGSGCTPHAGQRSGQGRRFRTPRSPRTERHLSSVRKRVSTT